MWLKRDYDKTRTRGRALQRRRKRWFEAHPLCVACEAKDRISAATELDHIIPLSQGGSDNDPANWQGLCQPCHQAKSLAEKGYKTKPSIGADGWPV